MESDFLIWVRHFILPILSIDVKNKNPDPIRLIPFIPFIPR